MGVCFCIWCFSLVKSKALHWEDQNGCPHCIEKRKPLDLKRHAKGKSWLGVPYISWVSDLVPQLETMLPLLRLSQCELGFFMQHPVLLQTKGLSFFFLLPTALFFTSVHTFQPGQSAADCSQVLFKKAWCIYNWKTSWSFSSPPVRHGWLLSSWLLFSAFILCWLENISDSFYCFIDPVARKPVCVKTSVCSCAIGYRRGVVRHDCIHCNACSTE